MKILIYVLIAFFLMVVTFSSRDGSAGVFAWIAIIFLVFALVALNVKAASATRKTITALTGPITVRSMDRNRGSAIVPGFPAGGRTTGWMDVQVGNTHAFMRTTVSVSDGDIVTAAGLAGADFEILALRSHATGTVYSLPDPTFGFGQFAFHVALGTVVLLPVLIGIFTLTRTTRRYNWTNAMRAALADSRRMAERGPVPGPAVPAPTPGSLDGAIGVPPVP